MKIQGCISYILIKIFILVKPIYITQIFVINTDNNLSVLSKIIVSRSHMPTSESLYVEKTTVSQHMMLVYLFRPLNKSIIFIF